MGSATNRTEPNILFITVDQLRVDTIGCYGQQVADGLTPTIDRLAEESVLFEQCTTVAPVCAPARASLMTGRYPHNHGQISNGFRLGDGERPFWTHFSERGYRTAGIGKMHVEPWDDSLQWEYNRRIEGKDFRGDDEYAAFLRGKGYPFSRPRYAPELKDKPFYSTAFINALPKGETIDEYIADRAVEFLDSLKDDGRPFVSWVSFCNPHHPLDPPEEYYRMFADAPVPPHRYREGEGEEKPPEQQVHRAWNDIDESERKKAWRAYYACTRLVDDQIARVLDALDRSGRRQNTIVVFSSDHGEMLFDHGLFDKAFFFYESVVRVPLLISWPSQLAPRRTDALCENIDLIPTLLNLAGITAPLPMQGKSLVPLLRGERENHRDCTVSEHFYIRMIRTRNEKLVFYEGKEYGELYDLAADPYELNNLWNSPSAQQQRARLTEMLLHRTIDDADPQFRELPEPTNKGSYKWVF